MAIYQVVFENIKLQNWYFAHHGLFVKFPFALILIHFNFSVYIFSPFRQYAFKLDLMRKYFFTSTSFFSQDRFHAQAGSLHTCPTLGKNVVTLKRGSEIRALMKIFDFNISLDFYNVQPTILSAVYSPHKPWVPGDHAVQLRPWIRTWICP